MQRIEVTRRTRGIIFTAGYESLYNTRRISCARFSKEIKNALCHKIIYIHIYYSYCLCIDTIIINVFTKGM